MSDAAHGRAAPAPARTPCSECTTGLRFAFARAVLGDMGTTLTCDYLSQSALKLNKIKSSVLQGHQPHFQCCVATWASGCRTAAQMQAPVSQALGPHPAKALAAGTSCPDVQALTPGLPPAPGDRLSGRPASGGHSVPGGPSSVLQVSQRNLQCPGEFSWAHSDWPSPRFRLTVPPAPSVLPESPPHEPPAPEASSHVLLPESPARHLRM